MKLIPEIPYGCNSAQFVGAVRVMLDNVIEMAAVIEKLEAELVELQKRVGELEGK